MSDADTIRVRPATKEDASDIARLAGGLHAALGDPCGNFTAERVLADGFFASPEFKILLAELDGSIVGYALYQPTYDTAHAARGIFLNDLFVVAEARGRGVGRALVEAVQSVARENDREFVWWVTDPDDDTAAAFYRSLKPQHEKLVRAQALLAKDA